MRPASVRRTRMTSGKHPEGRAGRTTRKTGHSALSERPGLLDPRVLSAVGPRGPLGPWQRAIMDGQSAAGGRLVGREHAVAALDELLDRLRHARTGALAFVGEA